MKKKHREQSTRGHEQVEGQNSAQATGARGDILVSVIVFAAVAITVLIGLTNWGTAMLKSLWTIQSREQAFQVAEAGIDYYRWHLAQSPTDYKDGTTAPGPYYHNFYDKNGALIGSYALAITAPPVGSTKVVITSTGTTTANPTFKRIIQATLAIPSLAQYSVIANDYLRFGAGTSVYGPVESNKGIHFDGIAYNTVSSAMATYTDPDQTNTDGTHNCSPYPACALEWGVWTVGDNQPYTNETVHSNIFTAGRQFPVPAFDFNGLAINLNDLLNLSTDSGSAPCGTTSRCLNPSGASGYYIQFKAHPGNGFSYDTYDIYTVNSVVTANSNPTSISNNCVDNTQTGWGTWSINSKTLLSSNNKIPTNGVIFAKDNLWVDGQINGTRVTVVAAFGNSFQPNITVNNNLAYTNFDGSDIFGLIAQNNINVGLISADTLTIDAALVAENGRVGRFFYNQYCTDYGRSTINLNGMIATDQRYGFAWISTPINSTNDPYNCGGSIGLSAGGYCIRNITYDGSLLYSPPPSFPLASSQYQMISWQQIQ